MSKERSYYLSDFADEMLPCEPTLVSWAQWLSKGDSGWWNHTEPATDGQQFRASVMSWEPDIIATRKQGGWTFSRDPDGADFLAVRYGEGLGWSPDNIVWGEDMAKALRDWFADYDDVCWSEEFIAVGKNEPSVLLTYRADPPRLEIAETLQ